MGHKRYLHWISRISVTGIFSFGHAFVHGFFCFQKPAMWVLTNVKQEIEA